MVICQQNFLILALVIFLFKCQTFLFWFFLVLTPRSGFGAAISDALACSLSVFCISISADSTVMAASKLLGAAAVCAIVNRIGVAASRLR